MYVSVGNYSVDARCNHEVNQNFVRGEIKRKLNSGNASCHSVWNILSSSFQSKYLNLNIRIYIDIIIRVVVCGCDTWSLTQREIDRLRVFKNSVLRKIFGSKKKEVTGECRRLHNKELFDLYSLPNPNRIQGGSNMTGTDLCVNKPHCAAAVRP